MKKVKQDFPWFKNNPGYYYFDSGATSLKPQSVIDREVYYYANLGLSPHNADSNKAYEILNEIEQSRLALATLLNCKKDNIIFNSGATEGISSIASGIKHLINKNDEIILNYAEHGSNIVPWIELCNQTGAKIVWIHGDINGLIKEDEIINAITSKTKIISFANAFNLIPQKLDATYLCNKIKSINKDIITIVDATQFLVHNKMDLAKTKADFVVFSAHKMLGPTGIGAMYIANDYINILKPYRLGGFMNNFLGEDNYTLSSGTSRFEGGSPHTSGIIGWKAAIEYLNDYGWDNIKKYESELMGYLIKELQQLPNVELFNPSKDSSLLIFNVKQCHCQDIASYLANNKIIVRSGLSCAKLTPNLTHEDGFVRISLYIYNDKEDIDYLIKVLKAYQKGDELNGLI